MRAKFRSYQDIITVGSTPTLLLQANPNRSAVLLSNMGPSPVVITLGKQPVNGQGVVIQPGNNPVLFGEGLFGNFVGLDIWGMTSPDIVVVLTYPITLAAHNLNGTTPGAKLTQNVVGGEPLTLIGATVSNFAGPAMVVDLQVFHSGTTYTIARFKTDGAYNSPYGLEPTDAIKLNVTTADAAGLFDGSTTYSTGSPGQDVAGAVVAVWASEHCGSV